MFLNIIYNFTKNVPNILYFNRTLTKELGKLDVLK